MTPTCAVYGNMEETKLENDNATNFYTSRVYFSIMPTSQ